MGGRERERERERDSERERLYKKVRNLEMQAQKGHLAIKHRTTEVESDL